MIDMGDDGDISEIHLAQMTTTRAGLARVSTQAIYSFNSRRRNGRSCALPD
jgi:hypothetical protein